MTKRLQNLTESDHTSMTVFLNNFFELTLEKLIDKQTFTSVLAHVISSVDNEDMGGLHSYFEAGRTKQDLRRFLGEQ